MISTLSSSISEKLCSANVISRDEQELYSYGFFLLLSRGIFFAVAAIFGVLFETVCESILFYILFSALRGYAGGIHASKEATCMCCTTALLLLASGCVQIMEVAGFVTVPIWLLIVGGTIVFLLSPLDSKEKPLSNLELRRYRQISRWITVGIILLGTGGAMAEYYAVLYVSCICLVCESVLLLVGWWKRTMLSSSTETTL